MTEEHPRRGDAFEAWLKGQRDQYTPTGVEWSVADFLLDTYRLHADTGTPLDRHVCEGVMRDTECGCLETDQLTQDGTPVQVQIPQEMRCAGVIRGERHDWHDWQPQPGLPMMCCPGRTICPQCGEDLTDYDEDDLAYRNGDVRPYCSTECVVTAHRAGHPVR